MEEPQMGRVEIVSETPEREVIATEKAPAAVGPYSQAIRAGDLILTAGQLGIDPETGKLTAGGVQAQTRQALANLQAVLEAGGSRLDRAVKVTLFLQDMDDFKAVNEIYAEFFSQDPPARSAAQVAALPLGGLVMIEVIALR
jgi:2-iminobutanoate/2-iminopropanoate deaminase